MNISELILTGNLLEAKRLISEKLNELALDKLDDLKRGYAKTLFSEDFDANKFKKNTEMDDVKDAKAAGEDVGDDVPEPDDEDEEPDEDNEGGESDDDEDNKKSTSIKGKGGENITVNIKESQGLPTSKPSGVPTAGKKPSTDQPGRGAAENPAWKKKARAFLASGPNKVKVPGVVSEDAKDDAHGAKETPSWKKKQKALMKKGPTPATVDAVVSEEQAPNDSRNADGTPVKVKRLPVGTKLKAAYLGRDGGHWDGEKWHPKTEK